MMTGFGLGWVNAAADYSRYLPRRSSGRGVIGWTTFGSSIAPIFLVIFGLLLAGSSKSLSAAIAADPIGALANLLPTWYLIPFIIVAVLGLVGGSVLDIYSSGLALLTLGVRVPRYVAALIDGTIMTLGAIYVVFIAKNFVVQFEGFLITLGVPIAAWCGIMLADIMLRRRDYAERDLFTPSGRYGDIRWFPVGLIVVGTVIGWGLVTNLNARWLTWQGYLLGPFGLGGKSGAWAFANLGVLVALVVGFVATWAFGRATVRAQEAAPLEPARRERMTGQAGAELPGAGGPGEPPCLAVIDMQRVFGEPGSPWLAPAVRRDRGPGPPTGRGLQPEGGLHQVRGPRGPARRLAAVLRPVAVRPPAAGRADLRTRWPVRRDGRAHGGRDHVQQVVPGAVRPGPAAGRWCWPGCPPTAACCPPPWRRPTTGPRCGSSPTRAPGWTTRATPRRCTS